MNHRLQGETEVSGTQVWISRALLAAVFAYMLLINYWMPLHRDDYEYALIWGTLDRISSWSDVWQSLHIHYLTHGGRMVAFAVLDSFLLLGKQWFNPFNAFLFVALIVLVYWHSQRKLTWRFDPYLLGLITLFCWLSFPQFGSVNVWMTGACVYLLTAVLIFAFLLPYHLAYWRRPAQSGGYLRAAWMIPAGVVAGWTVENTAVTAIAATALLIWHAYRNNYLQAWMVSGFVGLLGGTALLLAAPGNYVRYGEQSAKLIVHVTNIIAGSGEMLLYMLPLVLFGVLLWRMLKVDYATKQLQLASPQPVGGISVAGIVNWALAAVLALSYGSGKFVSQWLHHVLIQYVAMPLGLATAHLQAQLANTLSGFEEMALYLLVIAQLYKLLAKKMALRSSDLQSAGIRLGWRELAREYPAAAGLLAFLLLAAFNNFVMIGSPRFPARATFGTVVFSIIGVMMLLSQPQLKQRLLAGGRNRFAVAALSAALLLPTAAATLVQYSTVDAVNRQRIAQIEQQAAQGATEVTLAPLPSLNRVLLHVYYIELSNPVSKYGLCRYYGLRDLQIEKKEAVR